jgi:hypothetical protein
MRHIVFLRHCEDEAGAVCRTIGASDQYGGRAAPTHHLTVLLPLTASRAGKQMAGFWDWRASSGAATVPVTEYAPELDPEPVEIYTATAMVNGMIEADGRRLSDILNTNTVLSIRDARSTSLVPHVEGTEGSGWTRLSTDDILFVMPPEHESPRQLRVNKRKHRVRIQTGQFVIAGHAHALPGIKLDPYVLRQRMHFMAITDAHVSAMGDPAWERSAPVVLVNVRPVQDLREALTIS